MSTFCCRRYRSAVRLFVCAQSQQFQSHDRGQALIRMHRAAHDSKLPCDSLHAWLSLRPTGLLPWRARAVVECVCCDAEGLSGCFTHSAACSASVRALSWYLAHTRASLSSNSSIGNPLSLRSPSSAARTSCTGLRPPQSFPAGKEDQAFRWLFRAVIQLSVMRVCCSPPPCTGTCSRRGLLLPHSWL